MRGLILLLLIALLTVGCASVETKERSIAPPTAPQIEKGDLKMKLTSDAFRHEGMIPAKYTIDGQDINPQLLWENPPAGTKSFALIIDDPDAPRETWVHWLVKDIPADRREIEEDSVPGTEVINDFGRKEYGGPTPPSGTHRYFFRLYALDTETMEADNKDDFYNEVEQHKIEEAVLMGKYTRG